jgi:hypothetical protein
VNWAKAWKAATRAYQRDLGSLWASFDQLWAAYQDATKLMFKALDKVSAVEEQRDDALVRVKELEVQCSMYEATIRTLSGALR